MNPKNLHGRYISPKPKSFIEIFNELDACNTYSALSNLYDAADALQKAEACFYALCQAEPQSSGELKAKLRILIDSLNAKYDAYCIMNDNELLGK